MVTPQLEYASDVWDPYHVGDIMELEEIQRRAPHWVLKIMADLVQLATSMLDQLSWPTLQTCHKIAI